MQAGSDSVRPGFGGSKCSRAHERKNEWKKGIDEALNAIQPQSIRGHRLLFSEELAGWKISLELSENDCQARDSFKEDNFSNVRFSPLVKNAL